MTTSVTYDTTRAATAAATFSTWSCTVRLVMTERSAIAPATDLLRALLERVDAAASRFRPESDLRWANVNTGRPVAASAMFVRLVHGALTAAELTDGALDPTVGQYLERIGYDRDILLVTDSDDQVPPPERRDVPTWRDVMLDRTVGLVTVPNGVRLDLGSTAKAQTADWAAEVLTRRFGGDVLVEIGGDIAVAGPGRDWQVTVAERAGDPGVRVTLHRGGLATSTTVIRAWQRGSDRMHHIIDPRTGMPADGPWRTATVAAADALTANAFSTAAIVLGEQAPERLEAAGVAARLVAVDGSIRTVGDWPSDAVSASVSAGGVSC